MSGIDSMHTVFTRIGENASMQRQLTLLWRDPVVARYQGDGLSSGMRQMAVLWALLAVKGQSRETKDAKAVLAGCGNSPFSGATALENWRNHASWFWPKVAISTPCYGAE